MKTIITYYKHFLIFLLIAVVSNIAIENFFKHQKNNYLIIQTELLKKQYETQYKYLKIMSHDIFSMYQDNQKLMKLFTQANDANSSMRVIIRDEMHNMLYKRYKRLVNMGVVQLHFHLKDNVSFLRMHKPSMFGDDLSGFRPSVKLANSTKKPQEGFESGRLRHGFRFVYPLFNTESKHIGSMEVSFSSEQLIEYITDKYVVDKHLLILKSEVYKNTWKESINSIYMDSIENENYLVHNESYKELESREFQEAIKNNKFNKRISQKMQKGLDFSISSSYNYNAMVVTFIAINDKLQNKNMAYLVLYTESDHLDRLLVENDYSKILLFSILFVLLVFSLYVTKTQHRLQQMAHFDKLTQLPNRAYFYIELAQEIKRAKRLNQELALMFIDLDGFKEINDTHGHDAGDIVLIESAQRLENTIRNMDIAARVGGDEFIVLLTNVKEESSISSIAQKIIDKLNTDIKVSKQMVHVGASIGIASFPKDANDIDTLIKNADTAMYRAKESGKNTFKLYQNNHK